MKATTIRRRAIDLGMTAALLLLMAYALVGEAAHEALGCAMLALMLCHVALNAAWYRNLRKGSYSPFRSVQTALDLLVLACMLASMASGILLSKRLFAPLGIRGDMGPARLAHLLSSYWGFCLMSLHLGMHWSFLAAGSARKTSRVLRAVALPLAAYGSLAFVRRGLWRYMLLERRFVFFDFEEPFALFLGDYAAIMVFFAVLGFALGKTARRNPGRVDDVDYARAAE